MEFKYMRSMLLAGLALLACVSSVTAGGDLETSNCTIHGTWVLQEHTTDTACKGSGFYWAYNICWRFDMTGLRPRQPNYLVACPYRCRWQFRPVAGCFPVSATADLITVASTANMLPLSLQVQPAAATAAAEPPSQAAAVSTEAAVQPVVPALLPDVTPSPAAVPAVAGYPETPPLFEMPATQPAVPAAAAAAADPVALPALPEPVTSQAAAPIDPVNAVFVQTQAVEPPPPPAAAAAAVDPVSLLVDGMQSPMPAAASEGTSEGEAAAVGDDTIAPVSEVVDFQLAAEPAAALAAEPLNSATPEASTPTAAAAGGDTPSSPTTVLPRALALEAPLLPAATAAAAMPESLPANPIPATAQLASNTAGADKPLRRRL